MKTRPTNRIRQTASSLVLVLVVTGAGALLVGGVLTWMSTNTRLTDRLNHYDKSIGAANAATEKVIAHVTRDFQIGGDTAVVNNLDVYRRLIPTGDEELITRTTTIDSSGTGSGGLLGGLLGVLGGGSSGSGSGTTTTTTTTKSGTRLWTDFEFKGTADRPNETAVDRIASWQYTNVSSRFPGLNGYCATYRVTARARALESQYKTVAAVKQDVQVASIPVFAYQVLYGPDLEIHPTTAMTFSGRVHCNGTIYSQPAGQVTFAQAVTASRRILHQKHPQDPSTRPTPVLRYPRGRETGVNSLNLALGTANSFKALHSILEIPPTTESRTSPLGQQRLYNKADLIILISNSVAVAHSGAYNNFSVIVPWTNVWERTEVKDSKGKLLMSYYAYDDGKNGNGAKDDSRDWDELDFPEWEEFWPWFLEYWKSLTGTTFEYEFHNWEEFWAWLQEYWKSLADGSTSGGGGTTRTTNVIQNIVNTNVTFYSARENKTVRCTEIDISQLVAKQSQLSSLLGRPIKTLYVADMRTGNSASTQSGIRIIGGQTLPAGGLTIASPNPLYVQGHYNVTAANLGTANTAGSVPAALIGDAITVLSINWLDSRSTSSLATRVAGNTTVNAALLGGIVQTGGGYYSGGVENFVRLLEDWTGRTLTLNGSIVALFPSEIAVAPWGANNNVYATPTRNWSYDAKLGTLSGLPPSTPEVRTVIRRRPEPIPST